MEVTVMKKFISGFLLGALIFALPVYAKHSTMLEAFYNDIKLMVYGNIVDTQGNDPFIVNGRTYVPARYVAEAMGGEVEWNETENTVEITKAAPPTHEPTKMTSDGLEALYTYSTYEQYLVYIKDVENKYQLSTHVSDDWKTVTLRKQDTGAFISFDVKSLNGSLAIFYNEYENILLPFILSD